LIARHIQVKGIGGADESGQGLVAAIALQPESATQHQLDQRFPFPGASLSGPQVLAAHAGEPEAWPLTLLGIAADLVPAQLLEQGLKQGAG
jgi:hypothetical protein